MRLLRGDGPPLVIGHRGAAALAPANTLASLDAAVEHGVDAVEFDVVADAGAVVLSHSLRERARERVTLGEALDLLGGAGVGVHVDVKHRGLEERVVEALRARELVPRALVSSVDQATLRDVRALEPSLALGLSYPRDYFGISRRPVLAPLVGGGIATMKRTLPRVIRRWIERSHARAAVLHHALLTRSLIERCHADGTAVFAWTVNDRDVAARLADWGADAIISDDPRIFGPSLT